MTLEMDTGITRTFDSGANRDTEQGKLDYEGFLSPRVIEAYATYMHFNRLLPDGSWRASDNWQNGFPPEVTMKSGWRHFFDWWQFHRGLLTHETIIWAICGLLFNAMAYLDKYLKDNPSALAHQLRVAEDRRKSALDLTKSNLKP